MNFRKLIQQRLNRTSGEVNLDSDVHAVVAMNVGEKGSVTHVSSTHRTASKPGERNNARPTDSAQPLDGDFR